MLEVQPVAVGGQLPLCGGKKKMVVVLRFPGQRHARASSAGLKPKTDGHASKSRAARASRTVKKLPFEIFPRAAQLLTADVPTPQSFATSAGPPSASTTLSTESIMHPAYSRYVESSTSHVSEIATGCEQWLNLPMISGRDFHTAVGERLKRLRLAYGKSQSDFAKTLGVGASAISNYEAGVRAVDPYDAFKLKMVYSAPMEWLFGGDESTLPPQVAEKLNQPAKARGVSEPKPRSTKADQRRSKVASGRR